MSADPLDFAINLADVRERITALGYFVSVTDIRDASAILSEGEFNFMAPAAFVSVASETAERNRVMGGAAHSQRVNVSLSVLFAEAAARYDRAVDDKVDATRRAIIRQLTNFTPGNAETSLQYDRYLLRATSDSIVWGEVLFLTSYRFTQ